MLSTSMSASSLARCLMMTYTTQKCNQLSCAPISEVSRAQNRRKCLTLTRGCPRGETVGPCKEWQETICTSLGKYFSKAARSGALTEVCPATMAPSLLATKQKQRREKEGKRSVRRRRDGVDVIDEMRDQTFVVLDAWHWLVKPERRWS